MISKLLVKAILEKADAYKWTIQGLGMLSLYLSDEVRLHIWNNGFKYPGVSPLHTHPWDFESMVVAGAVRQYRYAEIERLSQVTAKAESYKTVDIKCGPGANGLAPARFVWLEKQPVEFYVENQTYKQLKDEIHESEPLNGTVTVVTRTFKGDRDLARVFWKDDGGFVSAGARQATPQEVHEITQYSLGRWFAEINEADVR